MKIELYSIYEDERPLKGTVGLLDWHLKGAISRHIMSGHIKGELHELVYLPVLTKTNQRHLLLIGLGSKKNASTLVNDQKDFLQKISQTLKKLNCSGAVLSHDGFEFLDFKKAEAAFAPVSLELSEPSSS